MHDMPNDSFQDRALEYQLPRTPPTPHGSHIVPLGVLSILPGELVNEIYRYVVVSDKPINQWKGVTPRNAEIQHVQPNIARVSKQIREEVLSIFYAENAFALPARIGVAHGKHDLEYFMCNVEHWLDLVEDHLPSIKSVAAADEFRVGHSYELGCVVGHMSEEDGQLFVRSSNALEGWCKGWARKRSLGENTKPVLRENVLRAFKSCWSDLIELSRYASYGRCTSCGLPGTVVEASLQYFATS